MSIDKLDEKRTAGASYILTFYQEVQKLKHHSVVYSNTIKQLEAKYGPEPEVEKMEEGDKQNMILFNNNARYQAQVTYISYKSIMGVIKGEKETKEIKANYEKIEKEFMINPKVLEEFNIAINAFLLKDIIQNLLETSQALVDQIYNNDSTTTEQS